MWWLHVLVTLFSLSSSIGLKFSAVEDVLPVNISKDSRILQISQDDLLVVLNIDTNYVILGGRNAAYNVSLLDVKIRHVVNWPTNNATRHDCSMIISSKCDNYIRSYSKTPDGFVICGTHGQRPMCRRYRGSWADPRPVDTFPGEGLSPFVPTVKAPFVNSHDWLFTANALEYSTSADAILLRKVVGKKEKAMRTGRGESAFDSAEFVAMADNDKEVLVFFNELPSESEGCGLRKVARVGRVCKDDPGAISFPDEWSSFVKARLECSVNQDGYDSLFFNELTSMVSSPEMYAGVFRSQLAGLGFSAICLYPRTPLSNNLASVFQAKSGTCPRSTDDAFQRALRGKPLVQKKVKKEPIFVFSGEADVLSMTVQHNVTDLSGHVYNIFYLGTAAGKILKIAIGNERARLVASLEPLPQNTAAKNLWLYQERLVNQKTTTTLLVLTDSSLTKASSNACGFATNCTSCLALGDPHCAWILYGAECVSVEENYFRREYLTQQLDQCPRPSPVQEAKKNQVSLPCLCHKAEPCVTQVIQKELHPVSLFSSGGIFGSLFLFAAGLLVGALLNCICTRSSYRGQEKPARLDAYTSPGLRHSPRASMHSSIHTYC